MSASAQVVTVNLPALPFPIPVFARWPRDMQGHAITTRAIQQASDQKIPFWNLRWRKNARAFYVPKLPVCFHIQNRIGLELKTLALSPLCLYSICIITRALQNSLNTTYGPGNTARRSCLFLRSV